MGRAHTIPLVTAFVLVAAAGARAQENQSLSFLDAGKPSRGVPVSRVDDAGRTTLATTNTDGTVSIPIDALGFGKGETVVVWVKRCEDGTVTEVILTRENEDNPCPPEEGAGAGERCGCEKVGTFVVGDGPVMFQVGRPTVMQQIGWGAGVDLYQWTNFEDVSGDQPGIITHDASSTSLGFNGFLDYPCRRYPVAVGLDFSYTMLDIRSMYTQGTQTGDIKFYSVGPYVRVGPQHGRIQPYGLMSMYYTWNEGDFVLNGESLSREHSTWRAGFGGGLYYPFHPKLAIRADGQYSTTFKENDADDHIRWKFGLMYRPGGFLP